MIYLFNPLQDVVDVFQKNVLHHRSIVVGEVGKKRANAGHDVASRRNDHHWFEQRSFLVEIEWLPLKCILLGLLEGHKWLRTKCNGIFLLECRCMFHLRREWPCPCHHHTSAVAKSLLYVCRWCTALWHDRIPSCVEWRRPSMLGERCWWFGKPFSCQASRTWSIIFDSTGQDEVYTDKCRWLFGSIVDRNFLHWKTKKRFRPADWIHLRRDWLMPNMYHWISPTGRRSWSAFFRCKDCETFVKVLRFDPSSTLDNGWTMAWPDRVLVSSIFDQRCDVDNILLLPVSRYSVWKTRRPDHPKKQRPNLQQDEPGTHNMY